jgi:hypothetical protein
MRVGAHPFRASIAKDVLIRVSGLLDYEITHDPRPQKDALKPVASGFAPV